MEDYCFTLASGDKDRPQYDGEDGDGGDGDDAGARLPLSNYFGNQGPMDHHSTRCFKSLRINNDLLV